MTNKDKMLQLVFSDERLSSYYEFDASDYPSIDIALNAKGQPIVVAIAKIIKDYNASNGRAFSDVYNDVSFYLSSNLS